MSLAFVAAITGTEDGGGDATVATSSGTLHVEIGDLLVAWCKTEDVAGVHLHGVTDGSNSLTLGTALDSGGHPYGAFAWMQATTHNETAAFTVTWSANCPYKRVLVLQFRPDAGETVSLDPAASNPNLAAGTNSPVASGAIDGAGTDGVHVGGLAEYDIDTWDIGMPRIGTVDCSARKYAAGSYTWAWYNLYTSDPGSVTANGTLFSGSGEWVCGIIGFKSVAAAGGTILRQMLQQHGG